MGTHSLPAPQTTVNAEVSNVLIGLNLPDIGKLLNLVLSNKTNPDKKAKNTAKKPSPNYVDLPPAKKPNANYVDFPNNLRNNEIMRTDGDIYIMDQGKNRNMNKSQMAAQYRRH